MGGYSMRAVTKNGTAQTVTASQTDVEVSKIFGISDEDSKFLKVVLDISAITGTVDVKLQHSFGKTETFEDVQGSSAAAAVSGTGNVVLSFDITEDSIDEPLWPMCKVVVTTEGGESITVNRVLTTRRF